MKRNNCIQIIKNLASISFFLKQTIFILKTLVTWYEKETQQLREELNKAKETNEATETEMKIMKMKMVSWILGNSKILQNYYLSQRQIL